MKQRYFSKSHLAFAKKTKSAWILGIYGKLDFGDFWSAWILGIYGKSIFCILGISKNPHNPLKIPIPTPAPDHLPLLVIGKAYDRKHRAKTRQRIQAIVWLVFTDVYNNFMEIIGLKAMGNCSASL